ncbi:GmrSD restriction endonuclease domain-containing protein [Bacillus safensis]|uniref:GmrSD restriction endonuclease domain-containing protein n=1 Tax=Bacillus safensis TaxID=561879 RepID=UPI0024534BB0|nr:DUF262 domain-containing protein [Bacillus safensis]MDH3094450.1 DUF262 domain-containing protein [Bacillus safensis]
MIGLEYVVKLKNMEFKDVANYLGISPQTVSDWINGRRRVPPRRAEQLSVFLGVDARLLAKKLDNEDRLRIQYLLGNFVNSRQIRENGMSEEIGEGDEIDMESDQLSFDIEAVEVNNYGTIKELEDQISIERKEIKTESLDITISELANMYSERKVIDVHPEFQRLFRWKMNQKTKLIESILLGIPIPPLFVAEDERAAWDVIDGVQRLSTIFEFMGILRDDLENIVPASVLVGTEKLPTLEGKVWDNKYPEHRHRFSFQDGVGIANRFLNSKLKVIVVGNESNPNAKYDIFDRLNTGGSKLTQQEIRNALSIMINRDFYQWLRERSLNPDFMICLPLSEKALYEQTDLEYVLRFIVYRHINSNEYSNTDDIHDLLTRKMRDICSHNNIDLSKEQQIFDKTFELLRNSLSESAFKKYYNKESRFKGQVMLSSFEIIAIGVAENLEKITRMENPREYIATKVKNLYDSIEYKEIQNIISGRAVTRFKTLTELGKNYFSY